METLFAPVQHELSASLHDPRSWIGQDVEMRTVSVGQVQIDQIEEAKRLPVAFVKLDVERHEYAALIGMRSLLNRDKPVILLEGANREIEAFLLELGYRKYRLDHALVEEGRSVGEDAGLPNTIFLDRKRDVELVAPSLDEVSALVVDTTRPES